MRWRQRQSYTITVFILLIITSLVLLLNLYQIKRRLPEPSEHEISPGVKIEVEELRRKRDLSLKEAWIRRKSQITPAEMPSTNKKILNPSPKNEKMSGIYVREAYRVKDDEIRIVYLENQDNTINLKAEVPMLGWQPVEWFCFNSTCFDILFCSMATRIGSVTIPPTTPHSNFLHLTSELNEEYTVVPVNDVRIKPTRASIPTYNHTLGVCLQPIFFFTDWTVVFQFFESWIAQGATKFYFYLHSYSWQTKKVLDFYKNSLGDELELINWSDLPVHSRDKGQYDKDPNARVFRHGATAFMHDCMLRARSHVKFVANTDLDDLPVAANLNISKTLNKIAHRHPNGAQFKVDWTLSHQPQNWDAVEKPSDIKFNLNAVKVLQIENIRWDYRVSKKMFHRPERVVHFDMHSVYRNELNEEGESQYTTIELFDSPSLYFLHLRRFERHLMNPPVEDYNNSYNYPLLRKLNQKMNDQFLARLQGSDISDLPLSPWALEARETMRDLEQCRLEAFGTQLDDKNEMCQQSSAGCEGMLTAGIQFLKTPQTWINIAHKARFNTYVEKIDSFKLF